MAATPSLQKAAGNRISTTLANSAADSTLSLVLSSVSGMSTTGGTVIIDEADASKREIVYYESITGSTLTVASDGRGRSGTSAVAHDAGATVTDVITAEMFNDARTSFLSEHADNGTHDAGAIIDIVYPVGSIYTSIVSTNPGTVFGHGTWVAFAAGRTLVGLDAGQTEFDTVEEEGGAKTHTLLDAEIPKHQHPFDGTGSNLYNLTMTLGTGAESKNLVMLTSSAARHGNVGEQAVGDGAHNNLQPYIVVYFWKRTA